MENLGTEIGQKMRSAVKAKLIELGTGSTGTGYIDDELPDYVMIMVANKRSKQQMVDDLNLFLGSHTEVFVNWLHQVLQKLQEVTLPQNAQKTNSTSALTSSTSSKRKISEVSDSTTSSALSLSKKDKKDKKKDKKLKRKEKTPEPPIISSNNDTLEKTNEPESTTTTTIVPAITSITNVFANQFIEHAKKTLEIENVSKKEETNVSTTPPPLLTTNSEQINHDDGFDIPTISEIAENAVEKRQKEKEFNELKELQEKIYLTKQQLRNMVSEESEDEDFLNLKANDDDLENINGSSGAAGQNKSKRIPITMNEGTKKRSIHERLGSRTNDKSSSNIISLSAHRRMEKEIYVPVFRRKEMEEKKLLTRRKSSERPVLTAITERHRESLRREREREREREKDRERERDRERDKRDRSRDDKNRKSHSSSTSIVSKEIRQRIGSRVILKSTSSSSSTHKNKNDDKEDEIEVPVNSIVKIKPRPQIPKSKQASKNLLLRAMVEATRSTATVKPPKETDEMDLRKSKLQNKKNLVIQISGTDTDDVHHEDETDHLTLLADENEEELMETLLNNADNNPRNLNKNESDNESIVYVPTKRANDQPVIVENNADEDELDVHAEDEETIEEEYDPVEAELANKNTQFVVTLDGVYKNKNKHSKSKTPPPAVKNSKSIKERIGKRNSDVEQNDEDLQETLRRRKERFDIRNSAKVAEKHRESSSRDRKKDKSPEKRRKSRSPESRRRKRSPKSPPVEKHSKKSRTKSPEKRDRRERKHRERTRSRSRSHTPPLPSDKIKKVTNRKNRDIATEETSCSSPIYMSKSEYEKTDDKIRKRIRVSPIQFNLTDEETHNSEEDDHHNHSAGNNSNKSKSSSSSKHKLDNSVGSTSEGGGSGDGEQKSPKKIKKLESSRKFDDVPQLLSAVSLANDSTTTTTSKSKTTLLTKERCKYYPSCRLGDACEFYHPATPCKTFPNCKFGDKCLYIHPKCKYDTKCTNYDCNFMHSIPLAAPIASVSSSHSSGLTAPPLASSVVPVQNYKSIIATPLPPICKFYPSCTNTLCPFYHPKVCRFGKNCINKVECNFYHHDHVAKDKFKWISPFSA
uniref:Zinc finger CCCH domain-containing protein 14 n=1 Tax=Corethrella appendiculata TaxID=1370023 RepID=U5EVZ3_9DIPT